jgi:Capsule assembly protein Wzi
MPDTMLLSRCWILSTVISLQFLVAMPAAGSSSYLNVDAQLKHDLQYLNDSGAARVLTGTWPLMRTDVSAGLKLVDERTLSPIGAQTLARLLSRKDVLGNRDNLVIDTFIELSEKPYLLRTMFDTPRSTGAVGGVLRWSAENIDINLSVAAVANPSDLKSIRFDGSYVAARFGNWSVSVGMEERWWGPGNDGSLILSTNARPVPAVTLQRIAALPFDARWLNWLGPWTARAFIGELDDERAVGNALLFGMRITISPKPGLELSASRTAQWCGRDRSCDMETFFDLLLGKDNRGVNVDPGQEPGNQLGGIDIRWAISPEIPYAVYAQWIGEDTRRGGPEIGSWMRLAGLERWGETVDLTYRIRFEIADTACRAGGLGFSEAIPNCAYEHSIYESGYRYRGRSVGHSIDGDGLSFSLGATLVQSSGNFWDISLRKIEINRFGDPLLPHSLSDLPLLVWDGRLSHIRETRIGRMEFGVGYTQVSGSVASELRDGIGAFVRWRSH